MSGYYFLFLVLMEVCSELYYYSHGVGSYNFQRCNIHRGMLIHEADTLVGARLSHLTKYSNTYSELYPGATQILVRSEASFFWSSQATKVGMNDFSQ